MFGECWWQFLFSEEMQWVQWLEQVVVCFYCDYDGLCWYFDLYIVICGLLYLCFGVFLVCDMLWEEDFFYWLGGVGLEVLVFYCQFGGIFIYFSCEWFVVLVCIFELGKVLLLGENDLMQFVVVQWVFFWLLVGDLVIVDVLVLLCYWVVQQLICYSDDFCLYMVDQMLNFIFFEFGMLLVEEGERWYVVGFEMEYVLFFNLMVVKGLCVGLMLEKLF